MYIATVTAIDLTSSAADELTFNQHEQLRRQVTSLNETHRSALFGFGQDEAEAIASLRAALTSFASRPANEFKYIELRVVVREGSWCHSRYQTGGALQWITLAE